MPARRAGCWLRAAGSQAAKRLLEPCWYPTKTINTVKECSNSLPTYPKPTSPAESCWCGGSASAVPALVGMLLCCRHVDSGLFCPGSGSFAEGGIWLAGFAPTTGQPLAAKLGGGLAAPLLPITGQPARQEQTQATCFTCALHVHNVQSRGEKSQAGPAFDSTYLQPTPAHAAAAPVGWEMLEQHHSAPAGPPSQGALTVKRANCLWSWKGLQRVELVIKRGNCHWKNRKRPATLLRRSQHGEASAPSHIQPPRPAIHTCHSHCHRSWLADKRRPGRVTTLRSLPCSPLYHLNSLATLAFAARRLSRQLVPMLSRAGLCTSGASAAAAAAARPAAPRLAGSGALRQALQFRGLRGAALAPAQLRALGLMRSTAAGRQASRVYAVAAPAEVCQSGL